MCYNPVVKDFDPNSLARLATKAGIILMRSGAETYRVEETMNYILKAYGAKVTDSYATPTLLITSFTLDEQLYHNIKRVKMADVDLDKIVKVNDLSRLAYRHQLSLKDFEKELNKIESEKPYPFYIEILGALVCAFGFAFFFGGTLNDALLSSLVAMVIEALAIYIRPLAFPHFFKYVFLSMIITLMAIAFANLGLGRQDIIIISSLMLLVPGLAITNAIRDTVSGDLVAGLVRASEALINAAAIALGSLLVMLILRGGL